MITENELIISNKSYINKDFVSIYRELIDLAKTLSYKFDPETSNESDVAVMLLKLMSFLGDKVNYNTDKNVLERFMPSATQDKSMRELCEMMGYNMNYYIAPETYVNIKYVGDAFDNLENNVSRSFTLPRLSTIVTDDSNTVNYVLVRDCTIYGKNKVSIEIPVIEGELKTLTVLDSEVIQLENLDENNRVYFNDVIVAQNGIFIEGGNIGTNDWTQVDNLNVVEYNSVVYKFSFDSNVGLPYIEFPDYISNLIGDGLTIKYIVTDAENGNISSKILTRVSSPSFVYWDNSDEDDNNKISFSVSENESPVLIVTNQFGASNGSSPESINEAYNNFKKIIGTFTTLVTCRDYRNFMYNQFDNDNMYPLTSNLVVSDRKDDINFTTNIVTYTENGKESVGEFDGINAFNICVYPLNVMSQSSVLGFDNSFKRLKGNSAKALIDSTSESKCINHDYKYDVGKGFIDTDTFIYKNYLHLNAIVTPKTKVTKSEAQSIKLNINQALIDNFNARKVDFGYEIPYDSILETIQNADERIKSVSLFEPELSTKVVDFKGDETSLKNSDNAYTYLAKNILAGKIDMFDYDESFNFDFGQSDTAIYSDDSSTGVKYMTTEAEIGLTSSDYTLQKNEVIQLVAPNLITQVTYPYGINYHLKLLGETQINKGTEYQLNSGEFCVVVYTDVDNNQIVKIYKQGDIIKPKVNLEVTTSSSTGHREIEIEDNIIKTELDNDGLLNDDDTLTVLSISASQQIEYRTINKENLNKNQYYCAWLLNNSNNKINWSDNKYMLEEGEYFYRTDVGFNALYTYGSGTVITKTGFSGVDWKSPLKERVDYTNISDFIQSGGILAEANRDVFKLFTFNLGNTLEFLEQQIITLVEGDSIRYSGSSMTLTNTFEPITIDSSNVLQYKFSTNTGYTTLPELSFTGGQWKIRSRLDINIGPETPQVLLSNQSIEIYDDETSSELETFEEGDSIETTTLHQTAGGDLIDIQIPQIDSTGITYKNESVYKYVYNSGQTGSNLDVFGCYKLGLNKSGEGDYTKTYSIYDTNKETLIMIYSKDEPDYTISVDNTKGGSSPIIYKYYEKYSKSPHSTSKTITDSGVTVFSIVNSETVTITNNDVYSGITLIISKPRVINGLNNKLNIDSIVYNDSYTHNREDREEDLIDEILSFDENRKFFYNHFIDNSEIIEMDDLLSSYALYNYNNVVNKWVISQIDFNEIATDIIIASSSIIK